MVRDESCDSSKTRVLLFDPMTQVKLPVCSTTQVKVTFSPEHADLPAKLDVRSAERDRHGIVHESTEIAIAKCTFGICNLYSSDI